MRSACVLCQLGRCADFTPAPSGPWGPNAAAACSGLQRPELQRRTGNGGASDMHSKSFSTSSTPRAPWKLTEPIPPSPVQPHPPAAAAAATNTARPPPSFGVLAGPEQFRAVMRLLPSAVVVCTSAAAAAALPGTPPRGMTVSSLASLALRPAPLLTLNMAARSRTLAAVAARRAFNVHVLSADAAGARVAEWFRRGNAAALGVFEARRLWEGCGCEAVEGAGGEGEGEGKAPLLRGRGVLYGLRCRLLDDEPHRGLVTVRDDVVVVAEVVEIVEGRGEHDGERVFGLAYADRRYRQLGGTMAHED